MKEAQIDFNALCCSCSGRMSAGSRVESSSSLRAAGSRRWHFFALLVTRVIITVTNDATVAAVMLSVSLRDISSSNNSKKLWFLGASKASVVFCLPAASSTCNLMDSAQYYTAASQAAAATHGTQKLRIEDIGDLALQHYDRFCTHSVARLLAHHRAVLCITQMRGRMLLRSLAGTDSRIKTSTSSRQCSSWPACKCSSRSSHGCHCLSRRSMTIAFEWASARQRPDQHATKGQQLSTVAQG